MRFKPSVSKVSDGQAADLIALAKNDTISAELRQLGELDTVVMPKMPHTMLRGGKNPKFNTLAEPDVRTYIDWAVEFILAEFGRLNIGAALLRRLGQQLDEQAPNLPRRGKTPGTERSFTDMLGYRIINILSEKGKVPASLLPDYYYQ